MLLLLFLVSFVIFLIFYQQPELHYQVLYLIYGDFVRPQLFKVLSLHLKLHLLDLALPRISGFL
jgi:hypothetical protein